MTYQNLKTILIADDSEDVRTFLCEVLSGEVPRILVAKDGLEAVALIKRHPIDVVISDFRMPCMDGVELLAWCRAHAYHFPVIFMSSDKRLFRREEIALGDCCATMIPKPVNPHLLNIALAAADAGGHHDRCLHQPFTRAGNDFSQSLKM